MGFRRASLKAAFTPDWRLPEAKVVWGLRAALVALAVYSLAVEPRFTTRPLLFSSAVAGLAASLAFAFVPTRRPRTLKGAEAAVLASVGLHVAGHAFGLYAAFAWYDTTLHLAIPFVYVLVLYALSQATNWVWNWKTVTPFEVGLYLFSMAVTIATIWEAMEFGMDQIFKTKEQDGLFDTMIDLLAGIAGALVGAAIAGYVTRVGRIRGHDRVSEQPKRRPSSRA